MAGVSSLETEMAEEGGRELGSMAGVSSLETEMAEVSDLTAGTGEDTQLVTVSSSVRSFSFWRLSSLLFLISSSSGLT